MEYSDLGDSYEWESEFREWREKRKEVQRLTTESGEFPQIKKEYSENFILQNLLDEN
jgi:hypothetical protein